MTERSVLNSHAFVDDVLANLQQRNIQLSNDDFGTGYSALSYLHALLVSCLKVDRSFVQPITEDADSLGIGPLSEPIPLAFSRTKAQYYAADKMKASAEQFGF